MKGTKLTERQRMFATEHQPEEFLAKRGLDYDDYYDVVVFKFLKAVKQYDECERLHRQAFEELAAGLMQKAVDNYRQALKLYVNIRKTEVSMKILEVEKYVVGEKFGRKGGSFKERRRKSFECFC